MTMNQSTNISQKQIAILLDADHVAVFSQQTDKLWTLFPIKGEKILSLKVLKTNKNKKNNMSYDLLHYLSDNFNDPQQLQSVQINFIYRREAVAFLCDVPADLKDFQCTTWQFLRMELLFPRAELRQAAPKGWRLSMLEKKDNPALLWVTKHLLPAAESCLGIWPDPVIETESSNEIKVSANARPESIQNLQKNKTGYSPVSKGRKQRAQTKMIYAYPLQDEMLLSFLPALYQKAFTVLDGADLAALINRKEPFNIPSPYPEMSGNALRKKQDEFCSLASEDKSRIVALALESKKSLQPRPEMRKIVRDIEDAL